jgi:hypothetical protein
MKKTIIIYVMFLGGLFFTSCAKKSNVRITMDILLKATSGIRKDIGTAD